MKQIYVLLCLTLAFSSAFAQEKASPEQQAAYRKVITERAGKIASSLAITDAAKQERVTNIIRDQYNDLNEIYIVRDANLKALKLKYADDKTSLEAERGKEAEKTDAKLAKLHKKYLDKLSGQLTEAQVEQVKNGMTYNVLPITYKAYQEQILTLTEEQKKQILVWLTEAREHAIDAESYFYNADLSKPTVFTTTEAKASGTGFYCRKAIEPTVLQSNVQYSGTDWMEIRYAEVLLNLAESAAATGRLSEAYDNLKLIRKRAGIEVGVGGMYGLDAGMTSVQLINAVMYERQIEFAFEGKRFWDLRRRKLFETVLNGKVRTGIQLNIKAGAPTSLSVSPFTGRDALTTDQATPYFTLNTKNMDTGYTISWKNEYYFFGIPIASMANNPKLLQNKGWGGTFDPLQ